MSEGIVEIGVYAPPFEPFQKIARLSRECYVLEKIDGTNGQVYITEDGDIFAGSRTRWVTPEQDNAGFAKWVQGNKMDLLRLGPGRHFGEWWGAGIQRGYGLKEKRFSLFNVSRWGDDAVRPACCHVVPVLYRGEFDTQTVQYYLDRLRERGSLAAPGFNRPEGIVVYHTAGNLLFKKTIEDDATPKSMVA